jgi:hypothetical protein
MQLDAGRPFNRLDAGSSHLAIKGLDSTRSAVLHPRDPTNPAADSVASTKPLVRRNRWRSRSGSRAGPPPKVLLSSQSQKKRDSLFLPEKWGTATLLLSFLLLLVLLGFPMTRTDRSWLVE